MKFLGIDPGLATTGWGVVEDDKSKQNNLQMLDFGVISTQKDLSISERLLIIYKDLHTIIKDYKPDYSAVESLFFFKNSKTAINVGESRGVIMLVLEMNDLDIKEFTPLQVKDAVCGYGRASKQQVQNMVTSILGLDNVPKPDDAADALAVAICCSSSINLEKLMP
ncbi:crossover junction endodeoxyribonuclease RuvC [Candidatus Dojkabacteria bacterium]|nr:crossover junction endodeoxyribonuclease RuvC [Candidatus Dojkabacteria bacterium]